MSQPNPAPTPADETLSLSRLGTDYLACQRHEKGCSRRTIYTYASWLRHYTGWLEEQGYAAPDLTHYTTPLLRAYLYALSARGLKPRSIRAAFHPLRGLGEYLIAHHVLADNPCRPLSMPKRGAAPRETANTSEVAALLDATDRLRCEQRRTLARAVLSTFIYTGVRFQECLDLKVGDVDLETGAMTVTHGKGDKARSLWPPSECMKALMAWLKMRQAMGCRHDWLWAYDAGRRIGDMGMRGLLDEVKSAAGLRGNTGVSFHSLRHCFASRMLENGASLAVIKNALGHADIKTTTIYLRADERETAKMAQYASLTPAQEVPATPTPRESKPSQAQFHRQRRSSPQK